MTTDQRSPAVPAPCLRASFITLFPEVITPMLHASILGRGHKAGLLASETVQLRDFSHRKDKAAHHAVDDAPCGGGAGMLVRVDVAQQAIAETIARDEHAHPGSKRHVVLFEPRGARFDQSSARRLAACHHLVFFCGRYEGTDARVERYVDEVISIGDFVLTGGELSSLVVFDAVARLVPGVLHNATSAVTESHSEGLLEHRQYTRPIVHDGWAVPDVLSSGNHAKIDRARRKDSLLLTQQLRPDLFARVPLSPADTRLLVDDRVPDLRAVSHPKGEKS